MMIITAQQLQQMKTHAELIYPNECCGLLLGKITPKGSILIEVRETENSWSSEIGEDLFTETGTKQDRFYIAPEILLQVQKETRDRELAIIGVYHSHPDHLAIPSLMDQEIAWPEYSYIIVALNHGKATDLKCWKLDEAHQFRSEEIVLTEIPE
jgi:proteasome lid subunit RPN8/RPN11